jgi:glycosyltransferase involved in cell wall biosynthesis
VSDAARTLAGRRVLVVTHDFPPVRSPQALRALEFVRSLAAEAQHVDVVARSPPPVGERPLLPSNVIVHDCSPGWLEAGLDAATRRRLGDPRVEASAATPSDPSALDASPGKLNWKGRAAKRLRGLLDTLRFPDGRALWVPHARQRIIACCQRHPPDVALLMHEPAASLVAGLGLREFGVPFVADLADPVRAPYTLRHWRGRARRLEARVVADAGAITVTNEATGDLLKQRYPTRNTRIAVLPQGFTPLTPSHESPLDPEGPLTLCYTGRFYPFRDPSALLAAVRQTPGTRLVLAGPEMPQSVLNAAAESPGRIRIAGELSHDAARELQGRCDVLVSIGNAGTVQAPGKLHEYFGSGRPVLHVCGDPQDPQGGLVTRLKRGLSCANTIDDIAQALDGLVAWKRAGRLDQAFDLSFDTVAEYSWLRIGQRLATLLAIHSRRM